MGGTLFGFRKKKEEEGQTCPLCQLLNAIDAPSCTRCYYEFTVAAHRQTVSEITDEESGGLFDALLEDDEEMDEDSPLVDWTSHSFSMDDMTVEVSPYDQDGVVEVDQSISMEHQFDAPQQIARVKGAKPKEEDEYELTAADAPKNVTKFDTGDGPDLDFTEEEYSSPVVKLVEMTESEDVEPVTSASSIPDESESTESEQSDAPISTPEIVPDPAPENTPTQPVTIPDVPVVPSVPAIPAVPEVPAIPAVPEIPSTPSDAMASPTPTPQSSGIWPWPQTEEWDDSTIRKMLRDAMESAKAGNIDDSKRTIVSLGPHLGERVDLIFHIGVLLKKFGQEEVMRRMIESAKTQYPDSPDVAKAVQHLLS